MPNSIVVIVKYYSKYMMPHPWTVFLLNLLQNLKCWASLKNRRDLKYTKCKYYILSNKSFIVYNFSPFDYDQIAEASNRYNIWNAFQNTHIHPVWHSHSPMSMSCLP